MSILIQFVLYFKNNFNNFDDEILLETDESELADIVLNQTDSSGTDSGYRLVSETLPLNFIDFDGISITHGTQAGEFGVLVDETDGDRIISENTETTEETPCKILPSPLEPLSSVKISDSPLMRQTSMSLVPPIMLLSPKMIPLLWEELVKRQRLKRELPLLKLLLRPLLPNTT